MTARAAENSFHDPRGTRRPAIRVGPEPYHWLFGQIGRGRAEACRQIVWQANTVHPNRQHCGESLVLGQMQSGSEAPERPHAGAGPIGHRRSRGLLAAHHDNLIAPHRQLIHRSGQQGGFAQARQCLVAAKPRGSAACQNAAQNHDFGKALAGTAEPDRAAVAGSAEVAEAGWNGWAELQSIGRFPVCGCGCGEPVARLAQARSMRMRPAVCKRQLAGVKQSGQGWNASPHPASACERLRIPLRRRARSFRGASLNASCPGWPDGGVVT